MCRFLEGDGRRKLTTIQVIVVWDFRQYWRLNHLPGLENEIHDQNSAVRQGSYHHQSGQRLLGLRGNTPSVTPGLMQNLGKKPDFRRFLDPENAFCLS
jgi:hypothetical protein